MKRPAPVLVLAVGNLSRGDDALGPLLAERVDAAGLADVEVLVDYQLQVEHALDLVGRERVIFVDAGVGTLPPFEFRRVVPAADFLHTSHALSPEAVLATFVRVQGEPPPECWVLCIAGERFGLGEDLSKEACERLEAACEALLTGIARPGGIFAPRPRQLRPCRDCRRITDVPTTPAPAARAT